MQFQVTFADGHILEIETDEAAKAVILAEAWAITHRDIWTAVTVTAAGDVFEVIPGGVVVKGKSPRSTAAAALGSAKKSGQSCRRPH